MGIRADIMKEMTPHVYTHSTGCALDAVLDTIQENEELVNILAKAMYDAFGYTVVSFDEIGFEYEDSARAAIGAFVKELGDHP